MGQKLVLNSQLFLAAPVEFRDQAVTLDGVPDGPDQRGAVDLALHQVILRTLMDRPDGHRFVGMAG